jgi:hypothetical protein
MFEQQQLNKQEIVQIQDQQFSNDIMARLLSVSENYALRSKGDSLDEIREKEIFGHYDTFESGKEKTLPELKLQLMFEIEVFRFSYEDFINKYEKYSFPENLTKKEILKNLNEWKNYVKDEDKKYYDAIIKIFAENITSQSFSDEIREKEKNKENVGLCDPYFLINSVPFLRNFGDEMMENVENEIMKNGKFQLKLKLRKKNKKDLKLNKFKIHFLRKIRIKILNNKKFKKHYLRKYKNYNKNYKTSECSSSEMECESENEKTNEKNENNRDLNKNNSENENNLNKENNENKENIEENMIENETNQIENSILTDKMDSLEVRNNNKLKKIKNEFSENLK